MAGGRQRLHDPAGANVGFVTSWQEVSPGGRAYAARFERLSDCGADMHGEADLVEQLVPVGARLLDAGCGTGRVAIRLAERGYRVTGVDVDDDMLQVARERAPALDWQTADLARLGALVPGPFDLIVAAGNVIPLVPDGAAALAELRSRLAPGGLLLSGFGLDAAHLPIAPTLDLGTFDDWCANVGLTLVDRWSSWDRAPYDDGGYVVNIHR